jgi:putative AbiEi antitoxin of type IV toxin-antitoxin system/uncharacterized protein DUF559
MCPSPGAVGPATTTEAASRIVTTDELVAEGLSPHHIARLVTRGRLLRLRRGVYVWPAERSAIADPRERHLLDTLSALRLAGPTAAAADASAAVLLGLPLFGALPTTPHLAVPRRPALGQTGRPRTLLRVRDLPARRVTTASGGRCTTSERTVVDIARTTGLRAGVVIADAALAAGTPRSSLEEALDECRGWPGIRRARSVVSFADGLSETPLESIGRVAIARAGLPAPELQVWIGGYRVDYLWRDQRTIGEADGAGKYTAPSALMAEKRREDRLRELGFEVVRFDWDDAFYRPMSLGPRFRRAFARGERRAA